MSSLKTSIRLATAEDAPVIAHIVNTAWKTAYAGIVPQSYLDALDDIPRVQRLVEGLERFSDLRYYLFEENGVPVGAASLHPTHDEDLTDTSEFTFFYFLPSVWRRGYGRLLLDRLKADSLELGFRQICCWVLEENVRAIAFYESQGMLRDGKRQVVTIGEPLEAVRCVGSLE
jgi:RimJ/RimL family protein N-acetyltransferase